MAVANATVLSTVLGDTCSHPHPHPHPLVACYYTEAPTFCCSVCQLVVTGDGNRCRDCGVHVHIACTNYLDYISFDKHPEHTLARIEAGVGARWCNVCRETASGREHVYSCVPCDFNVHPQCLPWPPQPQPHRLTACYYTEASTFRCTACEAVVTGNGYRCRGCGFHIHEECAKLPISFKSSVQEAEHTISLIKVEVPSCRCNVCGETSSRGCYVYSCLQCVFIVHPRCLPSLPQPLTSPQTQPRFQTQPQPRPQTPTPPQPQPQPQPQPRSQPPTPPQPQPQPQPQTLARPQTRTPPQPQPQPLPRPQPRQPLPPWPRDWRHPNANRDYTGKILEGVKLGIHVAHIAHNIHNIHNLASYVFRN